MVNKDYFVEQKRIEECAMERMENPQKISSYFKSEYKFLILISIAGIIYNVGLIATPLFEGQLAQYLYEVLKKQKTFFEVVKLAIVYIMVVLIVQVMRYIKRYYVRHFANDTSMKMRQVIYHNLIHKPKKELENQSVGALMTRVIADVDACAEGMRKFFTEIFDTGVVLIAYFSMMLYYDYKIAILASLFTPIAYFIAAKLKKMVVQYNRVYKKCEGQLNELTMDRLQNEITYRVYGCEEERTKTYENKLEEYEKKAVLANVWGNSMMPIYNLIAMTGIFIVLYLGSKNVLGTGSAQWNIAIFTAFISCFAKMAQKASKCAKLFNAVQKAEVSWKRIKPFLKWEEELSEKSPLSIEQIKLSKVSFAYKEGEKVIDNFSLEAKKGDLIGIRGSVASGKSTFGRLFLGELDYEGEIFLGNRELKSISSKERSQMIAYMGHEPELLQESVEENIKLGQKKEVEFYLDFVQLEQEIAAMEQGKETPVGDFGSRLSGGQQARVALARALYQDCFILVLDDPFSALDKKTASAIMDRLTGIRKDHIIFLISHREEVFAQCSKVLTIHKGGKIDEQKSN